MRIRDQLGLWRLGGTVVPVLLGAGAWMLFHGGVAAAIAVVPTVILGAGVLYPRVARAQVKRLFERTTADLQGAVYEPKRLRAVFDDLAEGLQLYGKAGRRPTLVAKSLVLMQEERWSEARAALEALAPSSDAKPMAQAVHENNLAWALAHDGAPGEAVVLAERALTRITAVEPGAPQLANFHGTLGIALTLDGQHAAALAPLRRALELGRLAGAQAVRHYYLGVALLALRQPDEACAAWQQASSEAPSTSWGRRAAQRLVEALPPAYR